MHVSIEKNKVNINGMEIFFGSNVDTVLEFPKYCIVLLMDDNIPDNNVEAIDYNGKKVWNISQIINFKYPESYISLSKEAENKFSVVTYNGVKFTIDVGTNQILNKSVTK